MVVVNVSQAKTQLSRLLARVEAGEEVTITRRGKPVAQLIACKPRKERRPGRLKGKIVIPDDFLDPLPEEELRAACKILIDSERRKKLADPHTAIGAILRDHGRISVGTAIPSNFGRVCLSRSAATVMAKETSRTRGDKAHQLAGRRTVMPNMRWARTLS